MIGSRKSANAANSRSPSGPQRRLTKDRSLSIPLRPDPGVGLVVKGSISTCLRNSSSPTPNLPLNMRSPCPVSCTFVIVPSAFSRCLASSLTSATVFLLSVNHISFFIWASLTTMVLYPKDVPRSVTLNISLAIDYTEDHWSSLLV